MFTVSVFCIYVCSPENEGNKEHTYIQQETLTNPILFRVVSGITISIYNIRTLKKKTQLAANVEVNFIACIKVAIASSYQQEQIK